MRLGLVSRAAIVCLTVVAPTFVASSAFAGSGTTGVAADWSTLAATVAADGSISGSRVAGFRVTHSDPPSGIFNSCTKVTGVYAFEGAQETNANYRGSYVFTHPLCSFQASDNHIEFVTMSDGELQSVCLGVVGQKSIQKTYVFDLYETFGLGVPNDSKVQTTITQNVICAAAPPPGFHPAPAGGTPAASSSPPATSSASNPTVGAPRTTLDAATLNVRQTTPIGSKPQPITIDPAEMQQWFTVILPAQQKTLVDQSYASLGPHYAAYTAAASAYETKLTICYHTGWSTADALAACTPTDSKVTCDLKLTQKCVAPAQATMRAAGALVSADAATLGSAASSLSGLTR